jgi:protein-disulfide isomerase
VQPYVTDSTRARSASPFLYSTCGTLAKILLSLKPNLSEVSVNRRLLFVPAARLVFASLGALIVVTGVASQTPQKSATKTTKATAVAPAAAPQGPITVDGVTDIDPNKAYGSKNATVIIETYTDFQCPACKQLYTTTLQRVMDNYVNSNKVYIVHRDFPLAMHAYSRVAASYARAACHIGKCDVVEQALFQNQEKWEANGDVKGTVAAVLTPAEMKKVEALVDAKTLEPLIEIDKQHGMALPVNQTPTTMIRTKDGQSYPVVGYVSFDVLKTLLDQLVK